MARPQKSGLDYFPFDTSFFDDIKIRKLIKHKGGGSVSVYTFLLCAIYHNGCYLNWDKDLPFIISERTGFEEEYVNEVLEYCLQIGLFSSQKFSENQVLTGKGIQERFSMINKISKRNAVIPSELTCITSEETRVITEETRVIAEETPVITESSTQIKRNKNKRNKETAPPFSPPDIFTIVSFVIGSYQASEKAANEFANRFISYYKGVDWMVGKGSKKFKMKSWENSISVQWKQTLDELMMQYPLWKEQKAKASYYDNPNDPISRNVII